MVDNLTTTSTTAPLSAKQGKLLNDDVTSLRSDLSNLIYVDELNIDEQSVPANSYVTVRIDAAKTGYTPIGVIYIAQNGSGSVWLNISSWYIDGQG